MVKNEKAFLVLRIIFLAIAILFFLYHIFNFSKASFRPRSVTLKLKAPLAESQKTESLTESLPGATQMALGQKININQASVLDLIALPDLGPVMAERIVKNRQEMGNFDKIEDIMRVKGLKQKKFDKIKSFIKVK